MLVGRSYLFLPRGSGTESVQALKKGPRQSAFELSRPPRQGLVGHGLKKVYQSFFSAFFNGGQGPAVRLEERCLRHLPTGVSQGRDEFSQGKAGSETLFPEF